MFVANRFLVAMVLPLTVRPLWAARIQSGSPARVPADLTTYSPINMSTQAPIRTMCTR